MEIVRWRKEVKKESERVSANNNSGVEFISRNTEQKKIIIS